MSAPRQDDREGEELLQRVLEGRAHAVDADTVELAESLARMRELAVHESALDARRNGALAERILASTTRAPKARPWTAISKRTVAAAVLAHAAALIAIAWLALRPAHDSPSVARAPERNSPAALSEPAASAPVVASPAARAEFDRAAFDFEAERELERRNLRAFPTPAAVGLPIELEGAASLLALRGRVLREVAGAGEVAAAAPTETDGALAIALWCEVALDHWLLSGVKERALEPLVARLESLQGANEQPVALARMVLERAQRCGLSDGTSRGELAPVPRAGSEPDAPLDRAWRDALCADLRESGVVWNDSPSGRVLSAWARAAF